MLQTGQIVANKYKILTEVGRGGMSRVYLAMDLKLNKQWAIKEIDKTSDEFKATVNEKQTLKEIEIMKKLDHPALPRIVDVIDSENSLCVVMDYIEGESLLKILDTYGVPKQETVVEWMLDVCDVLSYMHSQNPPIVYRDMKPSNIMLSRDQRIKVIDFGLAREFKGDAGDTMPLGTIGYASPEHFTKNTDIRSDVYTVGATMYQLLTGKDPASPPYIIQPIRMVDQKLSTGLEKIVSKATNKDPNKRYQNMSELANALESYKSLEEEHIEELETEIKSYKAKSLIGVALIIAGLVVYGLGNFMENQSYEQLISASGTKEQTIQSLSKAIDIRPKSKEGYMKLVEAYSSDGNFTESEASEFLSLYNDKKPALQKDGKAYADVSYSIGEAFLTYYTGENDSSARSKLLRAEPFFNDAVNGENEVLAKNYVYLANFYKSYILADASLTVSSDEGDIYKKIPATCEDTITNLGAYQGAGKSKMKEITYECILEILSCERTELKDAGVTKDTILNIALEIQNDGDISSNIYKKCNELKKELELTFK